MSTQHTPGPWACVPRADSGGHFATPKWTQHIMDEDIPGTKYQRTLCGRIINKVEIQHDPSIVQAAGTQCRKCARLSPTHTTREQSKDASASLSPAEHAYIAARAAGWACSWSMALRRVIQHAMHQAAAAER